MSNYNTKSQKIKNLYCENLYLSPSNLQENNYPGFIRFNKNTNSFEGKLDQVSDPYITNLNDGWSELGIKKAQKYIELDGTINQNARLGGIKIGHNLHLNNQGVLSSFKKGISRLEQNVLIVSNKDRPNNEDSVDLENEYQSSDFPSIEAALDFITDYRKIDNIPTPVNSIDDSFIIKVSPGTYNENIMIENHHNFITIEGESINNTKIVINNINNKLIDINTNDIQIKNLSLELNSNLGNDDIDIYGIYCSGNNILLENLILKLDLTNTNNTNSISTYGIYGNNFNNLNILNSNITIEIINLLSTSAIINKYCIFLNNDFSVNNNNSKIRDVDLLIPELDNSYGNGIGIHTINSNLELFNIDIIIFGENENVGINNFQSSIDINKIDIKVTGRESYGIKCLSDWNNQNTIAKNTINIIQNDNYSINFDNDEKFIQIIPLFETSNNTNNAEYLFSDDIFRFKIDQFDNNNIFYKLKNTSKSNPNLLFDDTINLYKNYFFDLTSTNTCIIEKFYLVTLNNCRINSNTNDLIINQYYYIDNINSNLNISRSENLGYYNSIYSQIITVGKEKTDFFNLSDALDSIKDNNINNRYLIKISPGLYNDDKIINLKEYVDIDGYTKENTIITLTYDDSTILNNIINRNTDLFINSFYVKLSNNSLIKNITFLRPFTQLTVIYNVLMFYENTIEEDQKSYPILENVNVINEGNAESNIGILLNDFYSKLESPFKNIDVKVSNGSLQNMGIILKNTNNTYNNLFLNNKLPKLFDNLNIEITNTSISTPTDRIYNYNSTGIILDNFDCYNDNVEINIKLLTNTSGNRDNYISILLINSNLILKRSYLINNYGYYVKRNDSLSSHHYTKIINSFFRIENENLDYNQDPYGDFIDCYTDSNQSKKLDNKGRLITNNNFIDGFNTAINIDQKFTKQNTIIGTEVANNLIGNSNSLNNDNLFVGYKTAENLVNSNNNTFLGTRSGAGINGNQSFIQENTFIGSKSGFENIGSENILLGFNAGFSNSGSFNISIGNNSGYNSQGNSNIFIGHNSGKSNTLGSRNIFFGNGTDSSSSGYNNLSGNDNIFLGYNSGNYNLSGENNLCFGSNSGLYLRGSDNVILGYEAAKGYSIVNSNINNSVIIGSKSGYNSLKFDSNIYIGYQSGYINQSGKNNLFLGYNSGYNVLNKDFNILIGYYSGFSIVNGQENLALGNWDSNASSEGNRNTFVGNSSGKNSLGNNNVIVGYDNNINGDYNILLGNNISTTSNNFSDNIFIGNDIGRFIITKNNIKIGNETLQVEDNDITSGNNLIIGNYSSYYLDSGINNITIGLKANYSNLQGNLNISIGNYSNFKNLVNNNISLGHYSNYNNNFGFDNIIFGNRAGYEMVDSSNNIFLGKEASNNTKNSINNLIFGNLCLKNNIISNSNVLIGNSTGENISYSFRNILIGNNSVNNSNLISDSIYIGYNSGTFAGVTNNSAKNIFIGNNSGNKNTSGNNNIGIGYKAHFNNTDGKNNLSIGNLSGYNNVGNKNIFLGNSSGISNTTGSSNIFLGDSSGFNNSTGENNVYIGTGNNTVSINVDSNIIRLRKPSQSEISVPCLFLESIYNLDISTNFIDIFFNKDNFLNNIYQLLNDSINAPENDTSNKYTLITIASNSSEIQIPNYYRTKINIPDSLSEYVSNLDDGSVLFNNINFNSEESYQFLIDYENFSNFRSRNNTNLFNNYNNLNVNIENNLLTLLGQTNLDDFILSEDTIGIIGDINYNGNVSNPLIQNIELQFLNNINYNSINYQNNIVIEFGSGINQNIGNQLEQLRNQFFNSNDRILNSIEKWIHIQLNLFILNTIDNNSTTITINSNINVNHLLNQNLESNAIGIIKIHNEEIQFEDITQNESGYVLSGLTRGFNNTEIEDHLENSLISPESFQNNFREYFKNYSVNNIIFDEITNRYIINVNENISSDSPIYITNLKILEAIKVKIDESTNNQLSISTLSNNSSIIFNNQNYEFIKITIIKSFDLIQKDSTGSGYNNTIGNRNLCLGTDAGFNNLIGDDNINLGYNAGFNNLTNKIITIGSEAGYNNTLGNNNLYIGYKSGYNNNEGTNSIFIGNESGKGTNSNTINNSIFIGNRSGFNITNGGENVFIGNYSGYKNKSGNSNVFIGNGEQNKYITPSIPDINISEIEYSGISPTTNLNNIPITFSDSLNFIKIFKIEAKLETNQDNNQDYGYITDVNQKFSKIKWPNKNIDNTDFNIYDYPEDTLVYITYTDNTENTSSSEGYIPEIEKGGQDMFINNKLLFKIKYFGNINSGFFQLYDLSNNLVSFKSINSDFYEITTSNTYSNFFYLHKFPFQIDDIISIKNNNILSKTLYKVNNITFNNILTDNFNNINNYVPDNSIENQNTNFINNINLGDEIFNLSNNQIELVEQQTSQSRIVPFNNITNFTILSQQLIFDFTVYKTAFEIPFRINNSVMVKNNDIQNNLSKNNIYYISDIKYYSKTIINSVPIIDQKKSIIINTNDINLISNFINYPIGTSNNEKFQHNQKIYILGENKNPMYSFNTGVNQNYSQYIPQTKYYYVVQESNVNTYFRISETPTNINNIDSSLIVNLHSVPSNSKIVIVESSNINYVTLSLTEIKTDIDITPLNMILFDNAVTNTLIVKDFSYLSNEINREEIVGIDVNNDIIDLYPTQITDSTLDISKLPYFSNKGGNWWGNYSQVINNNFYYSELFKLSNKKYGYNDILLLTLNENKAEDSIIQLNNNNNSIQIKYITAVFDSNNNFREERLYFNLLGTTQNLYTINNTLLYNTYLLTFDLTLGYLSLEYDIVKNTGYSNITGEFNTFIGDSCGYSNTSGYLNTFIGFNSGHKSKTSFNNTYLGNNSGYSSINSNKNTLIGSYSGYNTNDNDNIFIGDYTSYNNKKGTNNISIGNNNLYNNISSNDNISIGHNASVNLGSKFRNNAKNNIVIGNNSGLNLKNANNNIYLGNSSNISSNCNNKFLVNNQTSTLLTNTISYNYNSVFLRIKNLNDININEYVRIENNNQTEIIKILNKNQFQSPNNMFRFKKKNLSISSVFYNTNTNQRIYPSINIEQEDLTFNLNFNVNIVKDSFVYVDNESHKGIYILDSIENDKIILFNGENDLLCHHLLNSLNGLANQTVFDLDSDLVTTSYPSSLLEIKSRQYLVENETSLTNSLALTNEVRFPRQTQLLDFRPIFNCNESIINKSFSFLVFFKLGPNTSNLFGVYNFNGGAEIRYLLLKVENYQLKITFDIAETYFLLIDYPLFVNECYHISLVHESNAPLNNYSTKNYIRLYINGEPVSMKLSNGSTSVNKGYEFEFTSKSLTETLHNPMDYIGSYYNLFVSAQDNYFKLKPEQNTISIYFKDFRIYDKPLSNNKIKFIYYSFIDDNVKVPFSQFDPNDINTKQFNSETFLLTNEEYLNIYNDILLVERNSIKNLYNNNNNTFINLNFNNFSNNIVKDSFYNNDSVLLNNTENFDLFNTIISNSDSSYNITLLDSNINKWYFNQDSQNNYINSYVNFNRKNFYSKIIISNSIQYTINYLYLPKNKYDGNGDYINSNNNKLLSVNSNQNNLYYKLNDNIITYNLENNDLFNRDSFVPSVIKLNNLNIFEIKSPIKINLYDSDYSIDKINTLTYEYTYPNQNNYIYDQSVESYDRSIGINYYNSISKVNNLNISNSYQDFNNILDNDFNDYDISKLDINRIEDEYNDLDLTTNNWKINIWFNFHEYNDDSSNDEYILFDNYFNKKYITESRISKQDSDCLKFNNLNNSGRKMNYRNGLIENINYYQPLQEKIINSHSYINNSDDHLFGYLSFEKYERIISNQHLPDLHIFNRGSFINDNLVFSNPLLNNYITNINIFSDSIYNYRAKKIILTNDLSIINGATGIDDEKIYLNTPITISESDSTIDIYDDEQNSENIVFYFVEPKHDEIIINFRERANKNWGNTKDLVDDYLENNNLIDSSGDSIPDRNNPQFFKVDSSILNDNLYCIRKCIKFVDEITHNVQVKLIIQRVPYHMSLFLDSYKLKINSFQYGVGELKITKLLQDVSGLNDLVSQTFSYNTNYLTNFDIQNQIQNFEFISIFNHNENSITLTSNRLFTEAYQKGDILKIEYKTINIDSDNNATLSGSYFTIYLIVESSNNKKVFFTELVHNEDPVILPTPMESFHYYETTKSDTTISPNDTIINNNITYIDYVMNENDDGVEREDASTKTYFFLQNSETSTFTIGNSQYTFRSFEPSNNNISDNLYSGGFMLNVEANFKTSNTLGSGSAPFSSGENWYYNNNDYSEIKKIINETELNNFESILDKTENIYPSPSQNLHTNNNQGAHKLIVFYRYDRYRNPEAHKHGKFHSNVFFSKESQQIYSPWKIDSKNSKEKLRLGNGQFIPWDYSNYTNISSKKNVINYFSDNININNLDLPTYLLQQDVIIFGMENNDNYNLGQYYVNNIKVFGIQNYDTNINIKYGLVIPIISDESNLSNDRREITIIRLGKRINNKNINNKNYKDLGDTHNSWNNVVWEKTNYITKNQYQINFVRDTINSAYIELKEHEVNFNITTTNISSYVGVGDLIEVNNSKLNDGRYVVSSIEFVNGDLKIKISEPKSYNWGFADTQDVNHINNGYNIFYKTGNENDGGFSSDFNSNSYNIHTSFGSHSENYYDATDADGKKYISWSILSHSELTRMGSYTNNSFNPIFSHNVGAESTGVGNGNIFNIGNQEYLRYSLKVNKKDNKIEFKYYKEIGGLRQDIGKEYQAIVKNNYWNNITITQNRSGNNLQLKLFLNGNELISLNPGHTTINSNGDLFYPSLENISVNDSSGNPINTYTDKPKPNIFSLGRMYSTINETKNSNILSCPDIKLNTYKFKGFIGGLEIQRNNTDAFSTQDIIQNYQYQLSKFNNNNSEFINNGNHFNSIKLNSSYLSLSKTYNLAYDTYSNNLIGKLDIKNNKLLSPITNNSGLAMSMWIKIDIGETSQKLPIFSVIGFESNSGTINYNTYGYLLYLNKNIQTNNYRLSFSDNNQHNTETDLTLINNIWYFIGFNIYKEDSTVNLELFVNENMSIISNPPDINDISGIINNDASYLCPLIGRYKSSSEDIYFNGEIEDFKVYDKQLSYSEIQEQYNFRISFNKDFILNKLKTCFLHQSINTDDTEIYLVENINIGTNDIILVNNEQMKVLNVDYNNLKVTRGFNNSNISLHNEGSLVVLLDKPLQYSDINHKKHFINNDNLDKKYYKNIEYQENIEERTETLFVGGSIGIDGEIIVKPSIPREPPEGHAILWISDGTDDSIGISEYQTNSTGKLDNGLYIAYRPKNSKTLVNQIMKFSSSDNKWENSIYKKRNVDLENNLHISFAANSFGVENLDQNTATLLSDISNNINDLIYWKKGLGKIIKSSLTHKNLFNIDTDISSSIFSSTWQITNKFGLSGLNVLLNEKINYSGNYAKDVAYSSNSYRLLGNNNENALCCPNTGNENNKLENSYCTSPLIINNTYQLSTSDIDFTSLDQDWFKSSRVITFESFNNTSGYSENWYTSDIESELINEEVIKYRIITESDFSDLTEVDNTSLMNIINSKNWISLRGKIIDKNSKDVKLSLVESDIQKRSFTMDVDSMEEYSGADGTDNDKGSGWITYEATIPKCLGFQLLFGTNSNGEFPLGPSQNHVSGWYIRNIRVYKKL